MCKYKHSLTKIETSYIGVFLMILSAELYTTNTKKLNTVLLFLSSFGQFFVSGPKNSRFSILKVNIE